jgi:hypothetical protein
MMLVRGLNLFQHIPHWFFFISTIADCHIERHRVLTMYFIAAIGFLALSRSQESDCPLVVRPEINVYASRGGISSESSPPVQVTEHIQKRARYQRMCPWPLLLRLPVSTAPWR